MPAPAGARVKLGGKTRTLRLTMRGLYRAEEETPNRTPLHHAVRIAQGSVLSLALLTWAALLHEDDDLEIEDVLDMDGFALTNEELLKAIGSEIDLAYPETGQGKAEAAAED